VPGPAAEALGEMVRQRYGSQLEGDDMVDIKKAIEENLRAADRLKKIALSNADGPVNQFEALPAKAATTSSKRAPRSAPR
jgi:hypothetical protein